MDLVKEKWTEDDEIEFNTYLENLGNAGNVLWTRKILNTKLDLLAIKMPVLKDITKNISKGNYLSFLEIDMNKYYENMVINGLLITKIKDFDVMKKYLDKYAINVECWAACDILSFNIKNKEELFYNLSLEYIKSDKPFVRRIGILILFKFISNDKYIDKVFDILNMFYLEEEYYVNMALSWLFCECFIKRRDMTIKFLEDHKLNKFTINKGISKCRDSYRVTASDKEMLLAYKIK